MASVLDAVAAINTQLAQNVTAAGLGTLTKHIGAEYLDASESPPRIIWVPTTDRYDTGKKAFGNFWNTAFPTFSSGAIATVYCGFEVNLWATKAPADVSEQAYNAGVLALRDLLFLSLRQTVFGSYRLSTGRWQDVIGTGLTVLGRGYVLQLELEAPVAPDDGSSWVQLQGGRFTVSEQIPPSTGPKPADLPSPVIVKP